jgi:hypothetical protein
LIAGAAGAAEYHPAKRTGDRSKAPHRGDELHGARECIRSIVVTSRPMVDAIATTGPAPTFESTQLTQERRIVRDEDRLREHARQQLEVELRAIELADGIRDAVTTERLLWELASVSIPDDR